MKQRNKALVAISVISVLIFMILMVYDTDESSDKQFFVGAYYIGDRGVKSNPKAMYNSVYKTYDNIIQCSDEPTMSSKTKNIGNKLWILESTEDVDISYVESYATTDINGAIVYRFNDLSDSNIVAPANVTFLSSNVELEGGSTIMSLQLGTDYRLDITNVIWWCHIDKDVPNKHTEVIGKDGKFSILSAGTIIGKITDDTVMTMYKLDENGTFVNCLISDYYSE